MVKEGKVDEQRLCFILKIIGRYWKYQPKPGLLFEFYKTKISDQPIEQLLTQITDPKKHVFDLDRLSDLKDDAHQKFMNMANTSRKSRRKTKRRK